MHHSIGSFSVANRPLLVESQVLDHVIPYLFTKNFNGEIAYKGKRYDWLIDR